MLYVAILLGRSRGTEDIDIIIPKLDKTTIKQLHETLISKKYWCLNTEDFEEIFSLLNSKLSVRYAIEPKVIPNVELKFAKNRYDDICLSQPLKIIIGSNEFIIGPLELKIAFKEIVLKSDKDIEDFLQDPHFSL